MKNGDKDNKLMLIGRYSVNVGVKGRVAVPVKFRECLGKSAIISQGYEKSLLLVSRSKWEELTGFLKDKPLTISPARDTKRPRRTLMSIG